MMPNINKIIATTVVVLLAAAAGFYIGKTEENKMDNWQKNDPEMAALWDNFITNDVLPHGRLDSKTRHLAQLAAAVAVQGHGEYKRLLNEALDNGITPVEAKEVVYQTVPYAGMAKAYDFIAATNEVLQQRGISLPLDGQATVTPADRLEKGIAAQSAIFGTEAIAAMRANAPQELKHIQDYLSANCFGDYYTRGGLDIKTRELLTFVILVSMGGAEPQAKAHAAANIAFGNGREKLLDTVTQILPLIGYPRSLNAIAVINEVSK